MPALIQFRRDTAANWTANNPTLADGEMGLETDSYQFKIGNGSSSWSTLVYTNGPNTVINAANETANTNDHYPVFVYSSGSNQTVRVSTTKMSFKPSTGLFTITGNITASNTVTALDFNTTSDMTLKENIQTIQNPFDIINKINAVSFNWKDTKQEAYGVLAQEVQEVLPKIVRTDENNIHSVSYIQLIPFLLQCIKELKDEVDRLKK